MYCIKLQVVVSNVDHYLLYVVTKNHEQDGQQDQSVKETKDDGKGEHLQKYD
jgi:hypothetical protein